MSDLQRDGSPATGAWTWLAFREANKTPCCGLQSKKAHIAFAQHLRAAAVGVGGVHCMSEAPEALGRWTLTSMNLHGISSLVALVCRHGFGHSRTSPGPPPPGFWHRCRRKRCPARGASRLPSFKELGRHIRFGCLNEPGGRSHAHRSSRSNGHSYVFAQRSYLGFPEINTNYRGCKQTAA
jgi:hypothetical protein